MMGLVLLAQYNSFLKMDNEKFIKKLYTKSLKLAKTKWGIWVLLICAFADASFFPLPVTTFFLILIVLNTEKALHYSLFVVLGTMAGALAGYSIGHFAWLDAEGDYTGFVKFLFNNIPGFSVSAYNKINFLYTKYDVWILCGAALTPVPYGFFSILSGVFDINLILFFFTTLITQGVKYTLLSTMTIKMGPDFKSLIGFKWRPAAIITSICVAIVVVIINSI
jgi:membrane protein YqaA with SNARE-associated domain